MAWSCEPHRRGPGAAPQAPLISTHAVLLQPHSPLGPPPRSWAPSRISRSSRGLASQVLAPLFSFPETDYRTCSVISRSQRPTKSWKKHNPLLSTPSHLALSVNPQDRGGGVEGVVAHALGHDLCGQVTQ